MQGSDAAGLIFTIVVLVGLVVVYFLPAIVATNRGHQNASAIAVLNLFLGWTLLGWVVALVWAFTAVQGPGGQLPPRWSAEYDKTRRVDEPSRW